VFERHSEQTILGILQNGIYLQGSGMVMPPWQEAYMYPDARYDDDALQRIIDYLREQQPAELPEGAGLYQTPNIGQPVETEAPTEAPTDGATEAEPADDATEV
jgi:hypothetical protein